MSVSLRKVAKFKLGQVVEVAAGGCRNKLKIVVDKPIQSCRMGNTN